MSSVMLKPALQTLVIVIPHKKGMGMSATLPSFVWYDTYLRIKSLKAAESHSKLCVLPKEEWTYWYDSKSFMQVLGRHDSYM